MGPGEPGTQRQEVRYENATRLIWYVGDVKLEMLSNLPVEEMLKVTESMVTAEAEEGRSLESRPYTPGRGGGSVSLP